MVFTSLFLDRLVLPYCCIRHPRSKRRRHHGQRHILPSICYSFCVTNNFFCCLSGRFNHRLPTRSRFNSGPERVTAIASGDVQIGNLGSSPLAVAASRNLSIVAFIVSAQINTSEALVVRKGSHIDSPQDLIGKTIADFAKNRPDVVAKFGQGHAGLFYRRCRL
jgi:hypothetical protein